MQVAVQYLKGQRIYISLCFIKCYLYVTKLSLRLVFSCALKKSYIQLYSYKQCWFWSALNMFIFLQHIIHFTYNELQYFHFYFLKPRIKLVVQCSKFKYFILLYHWYFTNFLIEKLLIA